MRRRTSVSLSENDDSAWRAITHDVGSGEGTSRHRWRREREGGERRGLNSQGRTNRASARRDNDNGNQQQFIYSSGQSMGRLSRGLQIE